jgi:ferric-dicitrate binding protein FerR (iron transport regulator)
MMGGGMAAFAAAPARLFSTAIATKDMDYRKVTFDDGIEVELDPDVAAEIEAGAGG